VADSEWVVAIDPGHGGQDAGALGKDGTTEQTVNLGVALQLQRLLKMRRGAPVVMTRDSDYEVSAPRRLEAVANGQADVLLSLHTQSSFSPAAQGIMLFTTPETISPENAATPQESLPTAMPGVNASLRLAEALSEALVAAGYRVAPLQQRTLLPLGQGNLPRVMIEMGFLSNESDMNRLRDPAGQQKLARALFDGLETFLKNYQNLQEPQDEPGQPPAQQ
jgi:N-acetylmuramoyl-L-alanine amidase